MRLYRATPVPRDGSQLSSLVDVLSYRADLPHRPVLHVIPSMTLNAFAAGSAKHSAIAVTEGLLRRLSLREIAGVLAHEMSHIRNNDLWVMGLADLMTRFLQILSYVALGLAVTTFWPRSRATSRSPGRPFSLLYLAPAFRACCSSAFLARASSRADAEACPPDRRSDGARDRAAAPRDPAPGISGKT